MSWTFCFKVCKEARYPFVKGQVLNLCQHVHFDKYKSLLHIVGSLTVVCRIIGSSLVKLLVLTPSDDSPRKLLMLSLTSFHFMVLGKSYLQIGGRDWLTN